MAATNNRAKRPPPPPERAHEHQPPGPGPDAPAGQTAAARAARHRLGGWPPAVYPGRPPAQDCAAQSGAVLSRGARCPAPRLGQRNICGVLPNLYRPQLAVVWQRSPGAQPRATDRCPARAGGRHRHHRLCAALLQHGRRRPGAAAEHAARVHLHLRHQPRSRARCLVHGRSPALWQGAHAQPRRWCQTHHPMPAQRWLAVPAAGHGLRPQRFGFCALFCRARCGHHPLAVALCPPGQSQGRRPVQPHDPPGLCGRTDPRMGQLPHRRPCGRHRPHEPRAASRHPHHARAVLLGTQAL